MASTIIVDKIQKTGGVPFTLPVADATASGQSLQSDASGNLSWGDVDPDSGKGSNVASAAPTVIPDGNLYYIVTGTTNFAAFTVSVGRHFFVQFAGILTMTHHATNLDLPSEDDIITAAGDVAEFFAHTANQVQCVNYTRADGSAVKIKDESIDSDHYVDGSIDNVHLADDAVNSDELAAGSVDTAHIAVNQIDETLMKDAFVADFTEVTVASGDSLLLGDATDSGNTKRDTVQGVLDLVHDATIGLQTIWVPAVAMYPTTPTDTGCDALAQVSMGDGPPPLIEIKTLDFPDGADSYAQFSIAMPKSWDESTITFQTYWSVAGTNAGTVGFTLSAVALSSDEICTTAFGTAVANTPLAASTTANDLMVNVLSPAVTVGGTPAEGDQVFFQVLRDVSVDTQTSPARLHGIKIYFTTNAENDA